MTLLMDTTLRVVDVRIAHRDLYSVLMSSGNPLQPEIVVYVDRDPPARAQKVRYSAQADTYTLIPQMARLALVGRAVDAEHAPF